MTTGRTPLPFDAIVLAGGAARRLGGADKPRLTVGGRSLLERVLDACAAARTTVVVGPEGPGSESSGTAAATRKLRWTREQPAGGGPVAAVAAALAEPALRSPVLLLLAADLPFLDAGAVRRLVAALTDDEASGPQAAMLVDAEGRDQPLAAAYRSAPLRAALDALGDPAGQPLRRLTGGLRTLRLPDPDGASQDCDTWEDLARARHRAAQEQAADE
ncbi:molybdenum cofactor guanylyltransferase [Kitasatospora kifunensis]|uniref:Molybdopterin-guanine dinucleotide biosynthesis protein A n=1 Tax=Kitasatospora kifunensis TaxID=58351 RepID=A0A7W7R3G1_KITKI|nr:molybdopterin-guanine dinucleotide biosynthesis protein A [Kitasatospora kifunensis]